MQTAQPWEIGDGNGNGGVDKKTTVKRTSSSAQAMYIGYLLRGIGYILIC